MFNFKSRNLKPIQNSQLSIEALENREMLSAVQIFAAGDLGGEQFALQIDGQTVEQFTVGQQLSAFDFQADQPITASQVRIQFLNDQFDPANGIDANLIVDAIEIDGVRFETESSSVFSTGTFNEADGITPGFGRGEVLNANGFFQFADSGGSSLLEVSARGDVGNEQVNVVVGDEIAGTFTARTEQGSFFVSVDPGTTAGDVRIEFLNDQFDPSIGLDANLIVDFISIGGETFQTEDASVFSTGTFLSEDGIVDGFGRGDTLHTNGFFQFADTGFAVGPDRTISVGAEGFDAFNSGLVSNADGFGPGVAFLLDGASGDVNLTNEGAFQGLGQAAPTTVDAGDGIRLAGSGTFTGAVVNSGLIDSESAQGTTSGFRAVNGLNFQGDLVNTGQISGVNNGVYFGTGDQNGGLVVNEGLISSDSRALNIDGDGLVVFNEGAIIGTGDQRNGTIYSDNTASNFEIANRGLVDAGQGNDGAGVSLSLNNDGSNGEIAVFNEGTIAGRGQAAAGLATAGDGIRLEGDRSADGVPPGVFQGQIINSGTISSDSAQGTTGGFRAVNSLSFQGELVNTGVISGVQNGVYFGTGNHADGIVVNQGTISSDSRAVNIDGEGLELVNEGAIVGTGDQRNGTVYVDGTGEDFSIVNLEGLIDAGAGNDGSGIAIETGDVIGDQVDGIVFNSGAVIGRGTGESATQIGHGLRFVGGAGTDGTAEFTGDIVNEGTISGSADSELAAGISIEEVGLTQSIVNNGLISGSSIAIDASTATSSISVINDGFIDGDVLFGSSNDVLTVNQGGSFSGAIDGGAGFDTLNVNFASFDAGVEFVNSIDVSNIERINISDQRFA